MALLSNRTKRDLKAKYQPRYSPGNVGNIPIIPGTRASRPMVRGVKVQQGNLVMRPLLTGQAPRAIGGTAPYGGRGGPPTGRRQVQGKNLSAVRGARRAAVDSIDLLTHPASKTMGSRIEKFRAGRFPGKIQGGPGKPVTSPTIQPKNRPPNMAGQKDMLVGRQSPHSSTGKYPVVPYKGKAMTTTGVTTGGPKTDLSFRTTPQTKQIPTISAPTKARSFSAWRGKGRWGALIGLGTGLAGVGYSTYKMWTSPNKPSAQAPSPTPVAPTPPIIQPPVETKPPPKKQPGTGGGSGGSGRGKGRGTGVTRGLRPGAGQKVTSGTTTAKKQTTTPATPSMWQQVSPYAFGALGGYVLSELLSKRRSSPRTATYNYYYYR